MKKFVILLNGGVFYEGDKSIFNDEEIKEVFKEELEGKDFEFDEEEMKLEEGIKYLKERERVECYNCFIERGGDFSELSIEEVK
jgi:hypothetical protein